MGYYVEKRHLGWYLMEGATSAILMPGWFHAMLLYLIQETAESFLENVEWAVKFL